VEAEPLRSPSDDHSSSPQSFSPCIANTAHDQAPNQEQGGQVMFRVICQRLLSSISTPLSDRSIHVRLLTGVITLHERLRALAVLVLLSACGLASSSAPDPAFS
jgi:hypothetical protein